MATIQFIRIDQETDKAVKLVLREAGYDMQRLQTIHPVYHWIPKSLVIIEGNTATVADWFFEKNIAVDTYGAFMNGLSNH